jgi:hypothetical protein
VREGGGVKPSPELDVTLDWLRDVAAYGRACPTNDEGGSHFKITPAAFGSRVHTLARKGVIRTETQKLGGMTQRRRITIVAAGKAQGAVTGWSRVPSHKAKGAWGDARNRLGDGRPSRAPDATKVPLPSWSALEAGTDAAQAIHAEARRIGKAPTDFLVQLVALGWDVWRDQVMKEV